jgi:hypothetical protein
MFSILSSISTRYFSLTDSSSCIPGARGNSKKRFSQFSGATSGSVLEGQHE